MNHLDLSHELSDSAASSWELSQDWHSRAGNVPPRRAWRMDYICGRQGRWFDSLNVHHIARGGAHGSSALDISPRGFRGLRQGGRGPGHPDEDGVEGAGAALSRSRESSSGMLSTSLRDDTLPLRLCAPFLQVRQRMRCRHMVKPHFWGYGIPLGDAISINVSPNIPDFDEPYRTPRAGKERTR